MSARRRFHVVAAISLGLFTAPLAAGPSARPPSAAGEQPWRVEPVGSIVPFPPLAPLRGGGEVRVTGVSGITWLGADRFVAVMDNSRHLLTFALDLDPGGRPRAVRAVEGIALAEEHDFEDLAAWPPPAIDGVTAVTTLFLAEEDTPAVRRCHWSAARLDGGLRLPRVFRQRRPNRGVEAVAADPDGRHVWAANEEALEPDGPPPTETTGTVVRLVRIPIDPPAEPGRRAFQTGYAVAPPHRFTRLLDQPVYAGVVALVALGEGRLIVLERSGCPGLPPFANRVVLVETSGAPDVAALDGGLAATSGRLARTTTLWTGSIHANLEGLCLGPPIGEGRLLVGVTDDGGLPLPSGVMGFRLAYGDGAVGSDAEGGPNPVTSP